jgi:LuxR family transcriptional regulator, maltose regulon positive regulatory protein
VQAERGRLREAEEAFREVFRFVIEQGVGQLPAAGLVHIGMADITYERDDIDAAERELEMGIGLIERTREVGELVRGYVTLSKVKRARGDEEGALEAAREAERVARTSGANLQISIAAAWTARLQIARGDLEETVALEQERATNAASGAPQAVDRLTSARLLHALGRHDEALRLLRELREAAEAAGRTGAVIEILSLQALALRASNEKEQGVGTLTQALAMAEPEGFVRTFVDEGPAMSELLSEVLQARQRGHLDATGRVSTQYLAKLLAVLAQGASANGANARLAEPVSERELEVLALIAAGETNGEIAGKLFVSISTVKTHINNLYRKLGARSRTQAVARSRELGLL